MSLHKVEQKNKLLDFFTDALGVVNEYLSDPNVTDIMLNPDGVIWLDTFSGVLKTKHKLSSEDAEQIIRIASGLNGEYFDNKKPSVATELPLNGERFQGVMPPQSKFPVFAIRKKPEKIFGLEEYLQQNILTNNQYKLIVEAINNRDNIIVAGATGSGKTTFANALLKQIATLNIRVAILEDTAELQCSADNCYSFKTSSNVSMRALLKDTLRMNIDSIVVGELRGSEALDLLKAWNTGHSGGIATIHSDSALDALYRLEQLVLEAVQGSQQNLIARAVDWVVFLAKNKQRKRFIKEIIRVDGLNQDISPYKIVKEKS